jgi:RNA-directed DNA polymerase
MVCQVKGFIEAGYQVAVDADLLKFYDLVKYDILMSRLSLHATDMRLLRLIGCYLLAVVEIDGVCHPTPESNRTSAENTCDAAA